MPGFQFKIKGYLNEIGEYTEFHAADSGTIIQFILQHWFNESIPNNLDIVVIKNDAGDRLLIDHLKRDIFDYYFFHREESKTYYHKKTDVQLMFFMLENFFNNCIADIIVNLSKTDDNWKFIQGDFQGKAFSYRVTRKTIWRNSGVWLIQVAMFLTLIVLSILADPIVLVFAVIFLLFSFFLSGSRMRIYRQYYLDNRDIEITFSRASPHLEIRRGAQAVTISKSEIAGITKYIHSPEDVRGFADYYTEIEFINGNVLNLTCFLIPQSEIEEKFSNAQVYVDVEVSQSGKLRRKTFISGLHRQNDLKEILVKA